MRERFLLAFCVAAGSALGGLARWWGTAWVQTRAGLAFPWGTFTVNATGALLIGFIMRLALATPAISPELRLFLTTGICGGYTTFSTYTYETAVLLEQGEYGRAGVYALGSVLVALLSVFVGFALARLLLSVRGRA